MNVAALVEPAYRTAPDWVDTFGPEVADLAELAGFAPDPEQRMLLDAIFATDDAGTSAAFEVCVVCCRQNLKTALFQQAVLGWLFVTDERLVVWSAHEFRTVQEAFRDLETLVSGSSWLRRRVKSVHRGNGDEAIELYSGARIIFRTRTKGGGRGLSGNKVILDEAFALKPEHMGALLPTLSAQPDPQVLYGSSAGLADSEVLRSIRDRGRVGDPRLAYAEWCAPTPEAVCERGRQCPHTLDSPGCGCDDPELWQRANPAMGRRISVENIAAERRAMPPHEFGRERMGWWDDPVVNASPITVEAWTRCADAESVVLDPVAFAVDVTPDRSRSAIAVAGRRGDDRHHGELAYHQDGTGWVVDQLVDSARRVGPCAVALDPSGPAGSLLPELQERGFSADPDPGQWQLHLVSAREHAQACGALADDVDNDRWRHPGQSPLNSAIEGAVTRELADAWAWSRRHSGIDISPLVAVTLARLAYTLYGHETPCEPFYLVGS